MTLCRLLINAKLVATTRYSFPTSVSCEALNYILYLQVCRDFLFFLMFLTGYGERNVDQHKKLSSSLLRKWIVIYNKHENTTVLTISGRICDKRLLILLKIL